MTSSRRSHPGPDASPDSPALRGRLPDVLAILAITVLVVLRCWPWRPLAGNEPDVVPAARQWADPSWLPADWYLTLDTPYRVPFDLLAGPVAAHWGLAAGALVGRAVSYLLFAAAVLALLRALRVDLWLALVPLALFLGSQDLGAGEWMVGTAETKALAYPAALGALAALLTHRHRLAAALGGAAVSAHVLVGLMWLGSLAAAVLLVRLLRGRPGERPLRARDLWPGLLTGAWGLWVTLRTVTAPAAPARPGAVSGWEVYTTFRVPHHVLPSAWGPAPVLPWWVWLAAGGLLGVALVRWGGRRWAVVGAVTLATIGLHLVGLGLAAADAHELLRYYWFRLADTWVPFVLAVASAALLTRALARVRWAPSLVRLVVVATVLAISVPAALAGRSEQDERSVALADEPSHRTMRWVAEHLPDDAVVVADPTELDWYLTADRAAWVLYKSAPQAEGELDDWRRRLELATGTSLQTRPTRRELSLGQRRLSASALARLGACGATHYVTRREDTPRGTTPMHRDGRWVVLALDGSGAPGATCPV